MKITKIEAQKPISKKLRVAAYARVSDGKDAMLRSLSAQVSYYSEYIQSRSDWQYVGVFSDEAITGTTDERSGFQQMLAECRAGNIDMIITKAVTRFARNTVILLETVRELRQRGIGIYFEKENINTMSDDGELMLTVIASFAQEESRSVSENVKWHYQKKFEKGELIACFSMYGYHIKKEAVKINEEQAEVVRRIFSMYLEGSGTYSIAKILRGENVPFITRSEWTPLRVANILHNEKYTGNSLFQKTYTIDHLSKKQVINKGERKQYYAENTHPAIIDKAIFDAVQEKFKTQIKKYKAPSNVYRYIFTEIITCENCTSSYRRRINNGKPWWICDAVVKHGRCACSSKRIPEETLIAGAVKVLGLPYFDESVFAEEIAYIKATDKNILRFVFKDGREIETEWENKSRRESWTAEMRERASERQKENICRRNEICRQTYNQ